MAERRPSRRDLGGEWTFSYSLTAPAAPITDLAALQAAGLRSLPCQVPGSFYHDLYRAALIDDPHDFWTLALLRDYEGAHVWYGRRFAAQPPADGTLWLVFEGLDGGAEVYLNGALLGVADNALVPQRFALGAALQPENELLVHLRPLQGEAQRHAYPPGLWAPPGRWEQLYLRRAPHSYGSAITPRAVSPGIWRAVYLEHQPREHLGRTYLETLSISPSRSTARLALHYDLSLQADALARYELGLEMRCGARIFADTRAIDFGAGRWELTLREPQLWWPRGRGEANLYACRLTLLRDGVVVDERSFELGIRTLALAPERGLMINGEPLWVQGVVWGPLDCYHLQDRQRIPGLVAQVADLHCNLIRCWGGNVYEDDLLYALCDRRGILVWQEFAMLGAVYPQDDVFCATLRDEARAVVQRLRQHPSLALWVGDCDGDLAWRDHAWGRAAEQNRLTRQVLPALLAEEDPGRIYVPSAPADGPLLALGPRREGSEQSLHAVSCASPALLEEMMAAMQTAFDRGAAWPEGVVADDGAPPMLRQMLSDLRAWFSGLPDQPEALCRASQIAQAEALKAQIEGHRATFGQGAAQGQRAETGAAAGVIWWHLTDACTQISSAVVDHEGTPKLAYGAVQWAQRPLLLLLHHQPDGSLALLASSQLRDDVQLQYWVSDVDTDEMLIEGDGRVLADAVTELGRVPSLPAAQRCLLIEWRDSHGALYRNHYLDGPRPFDLTRYQLWLYKVEL